MCFHSQILKSAASLQTRFDADFPEANLFQPAIFNAFQYPSTPVIANNDPRKIKRFQWGLIPHWAKDDGIKKYTLNAREETIHEKPSFRSSVKQRCMILSDGFFEWQWLDSKGKQKQKYKVGLPENEVFGFAGLWSNWTNPDSGEVISTYTILTTAANPLMEKIHNTKKRMPIILHPDSEKNWLNGGNMVMQNDLLIAQPVT
ncbi:MAG: SOS response-associated peptidase [Cryomorphaceae bacterium]|nr:SOS response-associated peptidase [Cryomorphaceae bacterium]